MNKRTLFYLPVGLVLGVLLPLPFALLVGLIIMGLVEYTFWLMEN